MKFGAHENYCNGPGDCNCGQDYREFAASSIIWEREGNKEWNKLHSSSNLLRKEAAKLTREAKALENKGG